jgi:hypothetical protein
MTWSSNVVFLPFIQESSHMKFLSQKPFTSLALAATAALIVTSAYAAGWSTCVPACQGAQQSAYTASKAYYTTQQTNYCNGLADPAARSSCLAGVPAYAEQQAQVASTNVYNQCLQTCLASP